MDARVTKGQAQAVLTRLGVDTAYGWDVPRLETEINYLPEYYDGSYPLELDELGILIMGLLLAHREGGKITVVDGPSIAAPKTPRRKKAWAKRPGRCEPYAVRKESWRQKPVRRNPRKIGVMNSVIRHLEGATKDRPITKQEIHKYLVAEFPDRSSDGMRQNLSNLLPCRLREHYGMEIGIARVEWEGKKTNGYWIISRPD